jgi:hypothetical protein
LSEAIMQRRRYLWLMWFLLGSALAACAGGSGSSGFDAFPSSENAAIEQALDEQRCVEFEGLTICPADGTPTAEPAASPTRAPTGTPTVEAHTPPPSGTPLPTPTRGAAPTFTATATPTTEPSRQPQVDTAVDRGGSIPCVPADASGGCVFVVPFAPDGFPPGAVFRVAVRTLAPPSVWMIGPDQDSNGSPSTPVFDAPVAVEVPTREPSAGIRVQIAVLAFLEAPADLPSEVTTLAESGADFAFVTTQVTLQPEAASNP